MKKFLYDMMMKEYEKLSKEELGQKIMSLEEIECKDRCFANECMAGPAIYTINELFTELDELKSHFTYEKAVEVFAALSNAKSSWDFIKSELSKMNNDRRCFDSLEDFKKRVEKAEDPDDCI